MPEADVAQGVLPRIIATLVGRRRQVKGLMKDKTASPAKLQQASLQGLCFTVGLADLCSTTSSSKPSSSLPTRCTAVSVSRVPDSPPVRLRP